MAKKHKQPSKRTIVATRILIGLFASVAIFSVFFFAHSINEKRTLLNNGDHAVGTVINQDVDSHVSRSGSMTSRTISYVFIPKGSQQRITKNEFYVSKKEFEDHPQGSDIRITYLPSEPSINQPTVALRRIPVISVMVIYFIGIFIACYLCIKIGKALRKKYKIKKKQSYWNMPIALGAVALIVAAGMGFAILIAKLVTLLFL